MVSLTKLVVGGLLCVAGAQSAQKLPGEPDLSGYTYEKHLQKFNNAFKMSAPLVSVSRADVFSENMALILKHNADPTKTWFAAPNEFTDWTHEEFTAWRTKGTRPSRPAGDVSLGAKAPAQPLESLPDTVDWRTKDGVLTPVKDQGGCGSCWVFSAVETFESHLAIATKKAAPILSEQQIVSCAKNPNKCGGTGGCDGGTQEIAFNYTKQVGMTLEASYKYQGVTGTCDSSKIKSVAKNTGYVQLQMNNYTDMMNTLANVGPVAITIAAGGIGWQIYGGGVYSGFMCGFTIDHGVQMVGYGTQDSKDYWIIRNSWGPGWGEKGYMRIKRFGEGKEPCGVDKKPADGIACAGDTRKATYCGACGLLSSSSYPTGLSAVETDVVV